MSWLGSTNSAAYPVADLENVANDTVNGTPIAVVVDGDDNESWTVFSRTVDDDAVVELEVTETSRPGHVVIPHGFGLDYQGEVYGLNVNQLTKNTHRDRMFGTPLHRYVPCRVEPA